MESPIETLTPAFVPPTNPVPEDDLEHTRFHDFGIQEGLSIEKIELNFTDSRRRSVYGTIYINTHFQYVHTLYNRLSHEAETMGGDLTLCGPKYLLPSHDPTILYVHLRELGKEEQPFFQARVPLLSDVRKPFSGKEAILTIHLTPIQPCVLTKISVKLSYPQLVSGSVVAVQNLRIPPDGAKKERRVCLFKRHEDDPVRADDSMIKLDREVFLAPLWFEKSYIEKMHQLHREADDDDDDDDDPDDGPYDSIHPDGGFYNGDGSYVSVEIDLKLVGEDEYCLVRETRHYQFKSSDVHKTNFTGTNISPDFSTAGSGRFPRVSVTLQPFLDVITRMKGEPDEHDMPLYKMTESEEEWEKGWEEEQRKSKKPIPESEEEESNNNSSEVEESKME